MARITVEDCLKNVNNRFILVHMSKIRTRQLLSGAKTLVHAPENREIVQSLREIADMKVELDSETLENLKGGGFLDEAEE